MYYFIMVSTITSKALPTLIASDVLKARKKLKAAESELITEEEEYPLKRKRKLCKKFNFSSDEASSDDNINPTSKNVCKLKAPKPPDDLQFTKVII
ncbi:hypothetical protein AVEN_61940-1 [Araneus ventricosus]|uniref:Uncharacterized protein n=3 Tax=Araneus ventricosus TaxID=182803 RepID=A0A4Y2JER6_ARAVE|nr:hypothetical protein AVEN_229343-1 [Araneus ventricosus]GBM88375.1 hypothetical protein AVEN_61940-1 [Araneus ventricosus]